MHGDYIIYDNSGGNIHSKSLEEQKENLEEEYKEYKKLNFIKRFLFRKHHHWKIMMFDILKMSKIQWEK